MRSAQRIWLRRWVMRKVVRSRLMSPHGPLDLVLGGAVDGAGAVVEDQDARVGQEGARDGDALALAAGERHAALADLGLRSRPRNETMKSCACASRAACSMASGAASAHAKGDVLGERPREEEDVLLDGRDLRAQRLQAPVAHVHAVDQHPPASASKMRLISRVRVVLPEPVCPTMAIVSPGRAVKLTSCSDRLAVDS